MGLFEKQIPKYVRTPEEEVVVEPVVVDDIFDPLFNAEVKARLAQDYGNSPFATFAGYNELLNNIWTENDGTFGKGMGLLSAFGRSMEKADDLILGAATEAVEGISGQGFDNPIENIFVNDEDYTGRRFLAAAANTMRGFADGATVTEEDFNGAWGLPSLGIELMSDVGILGGGLARGLAPELTEQAGKRVPSSEIFRNLGKSGNATTTIGEVGQLLSDYDDLMTRAAIDITAPGLRPAFKALLPRIKQFVGFTDAEDFVDAYMARPRTDVNSAEAPMDGAFELYKNAYAKMLEIPETPEEAVERMARTPEQIAEDVAANAELDNLNEIVEDVLEQEAATIAQETPQAIVETAPKQPRRFKKALRSASETSKAKRYREAVETTAAAYTLRALLHSMQGTARKPDLDAFKITGVAPPFYTHGYLPTLQHVKQMPSFPSMDFSKTSTADRAMLREMYPISSDEFDDFYSDVYVKSKKQLEQYIRTQNLSEADARIVRSNFERTWKGSGKQELIDGLRPYFTQDKPSKPTPREKFAYTAQKTFTESSRAVERFTVSKGESIGEVIKRAREYDINIDQLGIDTHRSDSVSDRFAKLVRSDGEYIPIKEGQTTKKVWAQASPDFNELTTEQRQFVNEVRQMLSEALGLNFEKHAIGPWTEDDDILRRPFRVGTFPHANKTWWLAHLREDTHAGRAWWNSIRQYLPEEPSLPLPKETTPNVNAYPSVFNPLPNGSYGPIRRYPEAGEAIELVPQPSLMPTWDRSNGDLVRRYQWLPSEHTYEPALTLNPTYLEDVLNAMSDDSKLAHAIYTGEWSTNAATNAQVNAFLNDPKRKDDLFYRTSNPDWYLSPSERALVALPEVKEGVSAAYSMIDDLGYLTDGTTKVREALWKNENEFDDFVDSDGMQAALYTVFKYHDDTSPGSHTVAYVEGVHYPSMGDRHVKGFDDFSADDDYDNMTEVADDYFDIDPDEDPLKGHDLARELEKTPIGGKISKFKRLLGNVLFPKPKPGKSVFTEFDAFQALDDLIEFYDKNFDIFDVPYEMLRKYPDEMSYLSFLSNTLETIARDFIAPIKGMGNASRDARLTFRFKNTDIADDFTLNYDYILKSIIGQLGTHKPSYDTLKYILEPTRSFASFGFKSGSETLEYLPAPKQKLTPEEVIDPKKRPPEPVREKTHAAKVVDRFYDEVLPSIEYLLDNDINPYTLKKMKRVPKHVSLEKLKKAMAYLGYDSPIAPDVTFDPDHVVFRDIFNYIYLHGERGHSYAPDTSFFKDLPKNATFNEAFEHLASKGSPWGFKPSREATVTYTIDVPAIPDRTVTKPATTQRTDPLHINEGALTPEGVELWNHLVQLRERGKTSKATDGTSLMARSLASASDRELLEYFEDQVYENASSKRKYLRQESYDPKNPYALREVGPAVVRSAPVTYETTNTYTVPGRSARTETVRDLHPSNFPLITVKGPSEFRLESEDLLKGILKQEAQVLLNNPLWRSDVRRAYSEMASELERILTTHGISEERLNDIIKSVANYEIDKLTPAERRFIRYYSMEYTNRLKHLPYYAVDLNTGAYYGSQESRDTLIRGMINSAEMSASERDTILSIFNSKKRPTRALTKYVKKVFVDKLGPSHRKFTKFWHPVETLFDFDLPKVSSPDYIRLGESVQLNSDAAQFGYGSSRHGIYRKLLANRHVDPGEKSAIEFLGSLDYTKLFRPESREHLMQMAAKRDFQMDLIPDSPFKKTGAAAYYDTIRNTRYTYTVKPSARKAPVVTERVAQIIEDQPVEEVVTQFVDPVTTSLNEVAQRNLVDEVCPTISKALYEGVSVDFVKKSLKQHDEWRWFEQIAQASTVRSRNATGDYATLREKRAEDIARRFVELEETLPYAESRKYYILKEKEMGDILTGSDFWNEFISTGMFAASFPKGSEHIDNLRKAMQHNADVINTALKGDYVEVVVHNIKAREPNSVCVTMRWKPGKHDLIKRVVNNKQALDSAKFVDLVFSPPEALTSYEKEFLNKPTIKKLIDLEHEALSLIREHYARLGFTFDPAKEYTRHALNRRDDQGALQFFLKENFYGQISSETLDDISDNLATVYNTRRAFGSRAVGRRFRGRYWDTERQVLPLFSYSPLGRFKSAIASGALANSQYQAFTDFFVNDNFKIKGIFNSVDDLKKVLYATDEKGRLGNFTNAELVTFKVDATGRVIGLTKFDKTTDKGLQSALNDPNTILVPASVITSLDKMFRRETQMSNKFWVFINKYLTLPFKLGVLTNPGFLLGNISDASMKMATTMSRKYGTTFQQEAENTAKSISEVIALKNSYYDAFDEFLAAVAEVDAKLDPKQRIPDIVAMDPKSQKTFLKWLNDGYEVKNALGIVETVPCYLTSQQREAACFWLTLQTLQMNSSKLREFEEVAGAAHVSPYAMPTNPVERFIEGSGKYDPKNFRTWGFFMNNPIASGMLNASEGIEDVVRTASIVDDLRHKRYDPKRVTDILSKGSDEQITQLLVDIEGARNAMYSSQFDYERLTDFLDGVGTVVPFPIFFLKNFAYWMELFMENPQFVDNVVDVQEGLWAHRQEEDENDEFAKAAKGRGAIPIGGDLTGWFKGIYKPSPLQSMFGAFSLLNDPMSDLTYRVHPAISGVVAKAHEQMPTDLTTLLGGSDERSYRPYSTDIYEKNVRESDPNFDPMQYAMHRANPYERATQTYLRTPAKIANGEAQLSDFLPSIFQPDY